MKYLLCFLLGCGTVGVASGAYLTYQKGLSPEEIELLEGTIASEACPTIKRKTGRDCDIHNDMHSLCFTWDGPFVTLEAEFKP